MRSTAHTVKGYHLVKLFTLSTLKLSCMKPVPAELRTNSSKQRAISSSSVLVMARTMIPMGHA